MEPVVVEWCIGCMIAIHHFSICFLLLRQLLAGCAGNERQVSGAASQTPRAVLSQSIPADACPVTQPVWIKPPEGSAVLDPPQYDYYFAIADRSILASAWWFGKEGHAWRTGKEGNKVEP